MKGLKVSRLLAMLVLLSASVFVLAQSDNGNIQGTITDSTGAVVSGATIDVTSHATGQTVNAISGGAGDYAVNALKPGQYQVQVKAPNFASVTQNVTLQIGQTLPLNFALKTGAVTENVVVTTEAPLVATQTSDLGDVITGPPGCGPAAEFSQLHAVGHLGSGRDPRYQYQRRCHGRKRQCRNLSLQQQRRRCSGGQRTSSAGKQLSARRLRQQRIAGQHYRLLLRS